MMKRIADFLLGCVFMMLAGYTVVGSATDHKAEKALERKIMMCRDSCRAECSVKFTTGGAER